MEFFHQEAQYLAQKMGFKYEKEVAEKMMRYAEENLLNHLENKEDVYKRQMLTLMVSSMLIYAAPLIFTSIGGVFSERGGVVNVGLEGIMVMGAFSGVVFNLEFAQDLGALTPWLALLVGGLVGAIFSLVHAVATVH